MDRRNFLRRALGVAAGALGSSLGRFSQASSATPLFADTFGRKSTRKGWGKPWFNQRYQMSWGISRKKGFYDLPEPYVPPPDDTGYIGEGAARYSPNPVLVLDHDVVDIDLTADFQTNNENARFGLVARSIGYGDYYGAYVDKDVLIISRFTLNKELEIKRVDVAIKPSVPYAFRFTVEGTGPVSLKAKLWRAGRHEPAHFNLSTTDSEPTRQILKEGAFGLVYMHDSRTRRSAQVKTWNLVATSSQPAVRTRPRFTFAFAGRLGSLGVLHDVSLVAKSEIPADIKFKYGTDPKFAGATTVEPDQVFRRAGVAKVTLTGLPTDSTIYWKALSRSKSSRSRASSGVHSFVTPPPPGRSVALAFGSCTNFYPPLRSFEEAAKLDPSFFVHLGDFGYPEHLDAAALVPRKDCYQDRWTRMLARGASSALHAKTLWIMCQDDHDYGRDNAWRETVKGFTVSAFDELSGNWNGRTFEMRFGDLHAFVLDCHIASDDPSANDSPNHSILGTAQKSWLKQAMQASDARLLVVFTSLPFWGAGRGEMTWKEGFRAEGKELIEFFQGLQSDGRRVLICSGNAHAQFIARHPGTSADKDILEFVSSQTDHVTNQISSKLDVPGNDSIIDRSRSEKNTGAFGFVQLRALGPNRSVVLRSVDALTGRDVWEPLELNLQGEP